MPRLYGELPRPHPFAPVRPEPRGACEHAGLHDRDQRDRPARRPRHAPPHTAARPHAQEPRALRIRARARRLGAHRPLPPGEDPAHAAHPGRRGPRGDGRHGRHPGPGGDQHGVVQERGQRHPLRVRAHDPGRGGRQRAARAGHQPAGPLPDQPRQQHPLRRPQHPHQGGAGGPEGDPAAQGHHRRLPARPGHLHPPPRPRPGVRARQREQRARASPRAAGLPRRLRAGVQGGPHLAHLLPRRAIFPFAQVPGRHRAAGAGGGRGARAGERAGAGPRHAGR
mmetsp:Transcript_23008/g.62352  ORF Transcript_23008/g.62352 Transcript_23008/m.62352 type:complete len:281 (+) Transcript_23008:539-1381(+)